MPSSQNNREWTRTANKEKAKHAHDEIWDFNPDTNFHKMFSRESDKGIQGVLDLNKKYMEKSPDEKMTVISLILCRMKLLRPTF